MSPDGLEERTACADEALEATFAQIELDESEADTDTGEYDYDA